MVNPQEYSLQLVIFIHLFIVVVIIKSRPPYLNSAFGSSHFRFHSLLNLKVEKTCLEMTFNLTEQEVDQQYNGLHTLPGSDYRNAAPLG